MTMEHRYFLAPLQGFTDFVFRNCYHQIFGDLDCYFIPYISIWKAGQIRKSQLRDLRPKNNEGLPVVPQILCASVDEARFLAEQVKAFDYSRVNLNLGCPYPMATNRGRGSALLEKPDEVKRILDTLYNEFDLTVSVKFRAGMTDNKQAFQLIEILRNYPLETITFHPRTADQLYKGEADRELFVAFARELQKPLVYNGDILTSSDLQAIQSQFPDQRDWMIGRGILSNPLLVRELRGIETDEQEAKRLKREFHDLIFETIQAEYPDKGQQLMKMKGFWSYFAQSFTNPHKAFKAVKKSSSISKFEQTFPLVFQEFGA